MDGHGNLLSAAKLPDVEIARCDLMWGPSDGGEKGFIPVHNCEINPYIILVDLKDKKRVDDDDSIDCGVRTHYRWRRGAARAVCFFHPHRIAAIQCTVTLRCYCCNHCFERGHKQLRRFYSSGGKYPIPRQSNEFSYGVPCRKPLDLDALRSNDDRHYKLLNQAGLVVDPTQEQWTTVAYTRNFSPRKEDVGHQLKFECAITPLGPDEPRTDINFVSKPAKNAPAKTLETGHHHHHHRKGADVPTPDPQTSAAFWNYLQPGDLKAFVSVITNCVIPQAPLIDPRQIIPVGILALFSGAAPSSQTPQRIIPQASPLAKALGIGFTALKRKSALPISRHAILPVHRRPTDLDPTTTDRRETLLTDNAFAMWNEQNKSANESKKLRNTRIRETPPKHFHPETRNNSTFPLSAHQPPPSESFTVMTWNVLADIYATTEAYPYCEPFVLAWNYRRERLLAEMLSYNPDVICLQEVQADHFEEFFAPALLRRGYEGLYKQKTSNIFRGSGKQGGGKYLCDGCATFFKVPKFRLLDHFGIEFARVSPPDPKNDKRLNKDNVALVISLEQIIVNSRPSMSKTGIPQNKATDSSMKSGEIITPTTTTRLPHSYSLLVVANTHILANPEAPDVKIWQANTLTSVLTDYMNKAMSFTQAVDTSAPKAPGLVICGDFNSTPDSAVYQLVTAGMCDARHDELQSSDSYKWLRDVPLGHGLNLRSTYGAANYMRIEAERALSSGTGISGVSQPSSQPYVLSHGAYEPEFTNYTQTYVGCLDYIFFDDRYLKLTGTLDLLKEVTLMEEAYSLQLCDWALPSPQRSSDHMPLLARFEWNR